MQARLPSFGWLGILLVLLAAYTLLLPSQPPRLPDGVLTLAQSHRVASEEYLLQPAPPAALLVGSSMSAMLPPIALGAVYNLALSGGGALTGLRLAAEGQQVPGFVFIEANVLERPADESLLDDVTQPLTLWLKRRCEACRTRNQPLTVALAAISRQRLRVATEAEEQDAGLAATQRLNPQGFAIQLNEARRPPDARELAKRMSELVTLVDGLSRRGVRIVFVELPVHPEIAASVHQRAILAAVRQHFPPERFDWLQFGGREYKTTDGVHLAYADAHAIARQLAAVARQNPPRP